MDYNARSYYTINVKGMYYSKHTFIFNNGDLEDHLDNYLESKIRLVSHKVTIDAYGFTITRLNWGE